MRLERKLRSAGLALLLGPCVSPLGAQIPQKFDNLQVLPKDVSRDELIGEMRAMAGALALRCHHCHVGESADSLEGFDFASDEKDLKKTARVMMKMVAEINSELLPRIGKKEPELLHVRCVTCHHGQRRPQTIQDVLTETIENEGVDAAIARYRALREEYYGSFSFDFREWSLLALTESLAKKEMLDEAGRFLELNVELYPESGMSYFRLGQVQRLKGDKEQALASLKKAIELMPEMAARIREVIEVLSP
jgi:tetratricopeptide (TPR) repeat protein